MLLALFASSFVSVARADDFDRVVLLPPGWPTSVAGTDPSTWYSGEMRHYVCNDGSLPVFYFEPGSGDGADKWFIFLEGGGGCGNPADCRERALTVNKRNKMGTGCIDAQTCGDFGVYDTTGSVFAHDPAVAGYDRAGNADLPRRKSFDGLFSTHGDSPFENWNRVWVNYCSSDTWTGDSRESLSPTYGPGLTDVTGMMSTMPDTMDTSVDAAAVENTLLRFVVGVDDAERGFDAAAGVACNQVGATNPDPLLGTCPDSDWCAWPDSVDPVTGQLSFLTRSCATDTIFFNGHAIVDHLLDTLSGGLSYEAPCAPTDDDDGEAGGDDLCGFAIPALSEASTVVFGGGSAGAGGAFNNVDFVADTLHGMNPAIDVRGYFDSLWSSGRDGYFDRDVDGDTVTDIFGDGETGPELSEYVRGSLADGGIVGSVYHNAWADRTCLEDFNVYEMALTPLDYDPLTWQVGWEADCTDSRALTWSNRIETPHFWVQNFHDAVLRDNPCNPPGLGWDNDSDMMCYSELLEYSGWYMPTMDTTEGWFLGRLQRHVLAGDDDALGPTGSFAIDADDHVSDGLHVATMLDAWLGTSPSGLRAVDDREDDDVDLITPADPFIVSSIIDPLAP